MLARNRSHHSHVNCALPFGSGVGICIPRISMVPCGEHRREATYRNQPYLAIFIQLGGPDDHNTMFLVRLVGWRWRQRNRDTSFLLV